MRSYIFLDSHYLFLLSVLPALAFLFFFSLKLRKRKVLKFFDWDAFLKLSPQSSLARKWFKFSMALISLFFMILSLARPQILKPETTEKTKGIEIMILADVSRSMLAQDVKPNRLSLMKIHLKNFIQLLEGSHLVGLIAFAGSAFLISPLTSDLDLIQYYLDSLSTNIISTQGTDFTSSLKQVEKSFKGGSRQNGSKILIIASDGENHEPGALEQARTLIKQGVRIFTLGIGTEEGGLIPLSEEDGGDYQETEAGEIVRSQLKTRTLKEFAKIGEGGFYLLNSADNFSQNLHKDLQSLNQKIFEQKIKKGSAEEFFQYMILLSFIFALIYWIAPEKSKEEKNV